MNDELLHEIANLKSENKQLKDQLNELRNQFSIRNHLLESSPVLAWMVNKDLEFIYLSNSFIKGYAALANLQLEVGQKILEVVGEKYTQIWEERLQKALGGEELFIQESIPSDDGARYFNLSISPIVLKGKTHGVQVFINETTLLVKTQLKEDYNLKKLQQIFNQIQDVYYEVDLDGTITELSPAIKRLSGYTREELIGKDVGAFYQNKQDREFFLEEISKKGTVQNYISHLKDKDGKIKTMSINATLIFDDNKQPAKIVGIVRDITEIDEANRNLRWFRRVIEHSPVSIIITNNEGKIEYTNPFFTKTSGYKYSEVIGKDPSILKTNYHSRSYYTNLWNTILKGEIWEGEFQNKKKNGELFWEKAIISPVKNKQGKISNFIAIKEDFTKQKLAHDEIEKLKSFNERIINTMREGILVEDQTGTILFTNPAFTRFTGFSENELVGKNWKILVPSEHHKTVNDANQRRQNNLSDSYEMELQTKNGKTIPVLVGGTPIIENDKYSGLIAVFTDISTLKENQLTLKKAIKQAKLSDKLKSSFLANMSHEIRTPMNAILGFAEILKEERDIDEETRNEYFKIIEDKGKDLLQIISDIIDTSKIESELIEFKDDEVPINEFLEEILGKFKKEISAENKNIKLISKFPRRIKTVKVITDRYRLSQIINNLLNNAKKFTSEGEIELGYIITKEQYQFYVRDTGIGISKKNRKVIFQRFRQADNNYTRGFGGTGLGLNICKKLLKMMGGKIWVESKIGIGSTFYFTLPINKKIASK